MSSFVNHPLIKPNTLQARQYQELMMIEAAEKNTLIVLPTGLGKTIVFILLSALRLQLYPDSFILLLAPTKPLVHQHVKSLKYFFNLDEEKIVAITGDISPEKRKALYSSAKFLVATPQTIRNDLLSSRLQLNRCSLLCFDEAHRASGDYPYAIISDIYVRQSHYPRILAMSASPAKNQEHLDSLMNSLHLTNYIFKDEKSPDVAPFVQKVEEKWKRVPLPPTFKAILEQLKEMYSAVLHQLKELKLLPSADMRKVTRQDLLNLNPLIETKYGSSSPTPDKTKYFIAKGLVGNAIRLSHAMELLETQGIPSFYSYLKKLDTTVRKNEGSNALAKLVQSSIFQQILESTELLYQQGVIHPKLTATINEITRLFSRSADSRVLIFANFRKTAKMIAEELNKLDIVRAHWFVGQATSKQDKGLSQKEQLDILQKFRDGTYNTLVATSVAEEGLDIAQCDLVIFYDAVPSAIRAVQRRGRTGRKREGKVIYLIASGTRDEGYFWAARRSEEKMKQLWKDASSFSSSASSPSSSSSFSSSSSSSGSSTQNPSTPFKSSKSKALDAYLSSSSSSPSPASSSPSLTSIELPSSISPSSSSEALPSSSTDSLSSFVSPSSSEQLTSSHSQQEDPNLPIIWVDIREKSSKLLQYLLGKANLRIEQLPLADYVLSNNVAIERKTIEDLGKSIVDKRLFTQASALKKAYKKRILLVEGTELGISNVTLSAVYGAISSLILDFGFHVIRTLTPEESAHLILSLAKREQKETRPRRLIRTLAKTAMISEQQEFLIGGLPDIDSKLTRELLLFFKTPKAIALASPRDLQQVKGIGKQRAQKIYEVFNTEYLGYS